MSMLVSCTAFVVRSPRQTEGSRFTLAPPWTRWLMDEYKLTPSESAVVIGSSIEYRISELADRNAGVVARLRKDRLAMLEK